jgi:hypothetical protein
MARDVDISVGSDTSAFASGMGELRNTVRSTMSQIGRDLAVPIGLGAIAAYFQSVINGAHQIHAEAARFGLDAQQMQLISNAAKEEGISMEQVARAMNKAELAGYKAAEGSKAQVDALAALNINVQEFNRLNPADKILVVADAWNNATDKTAAYNAVAAIFGSRFGTELIPLFEKGSEKIKQISTDMGLMSDRTVEFNNHLFETRERLQNLLNVQAAQSLVGLGDAFGYVALKAREWYAVLTFDSEALKRVQADYANFESRIYQDSVPASQRGMTPSAAPRARGVPMFGEEGGSSSGASGTTGEAGSGGDRIASLRAAAEKASEEALHKQETLQQRLVSLEAEKKQIVDDLFKKATAGTQTEEDYYKASAAASGKAKEIAQTQNQITAEQKKQADEQDKYNEKLSEARQEIEKEADASERRSTILQLEVAGQTDVAARLQTQWEYEDKIADLTDQINEAWSEGDQKTAEMLTNLRGQVTEEEKLALAAKDYAIALRNAKELQGAGIEALKLGVDTQLQKGQIGPETAANMQKSIDLQTRMSLLDQQIVDAQKNGNQALADQLRVQQAQLAEQQKIATFSAAAAAQKEGYGINAGTDAMIRAALGGVTGLGGADVGLAAGLAAGSPGSAAYQKAYDRARAMQMLEGLTGKNMFSFIDRANANAILMQSAGRQQAAASAESQLFANAQISHYQAIAAGSSNIPPLTPSPAAMAAFYTQFGASFGWSPAVVQQMISLLGSIDTRLTPALSGTK